MNSKIDWELGIDYKHKLQTKQVPMVLDVIRFYINLVLKTIT